MRYFDTGVLLKLYIPEPNSPRAAELVGDSVAVLSALHRLEMQSALGQKLGRREIAEAEYGQVREAIERDIAQGVFAPTVVDWVRVFARAEELAVEHGSATLCRSFDTLHIALALELGVLEFCTFDAREATMAKAAGLPIVQ